MLPLSTALRMGSVYRPIQITGTRHRLLTEEYHKFCEMYGACALGAIDIATQVKNFEKQHYQFIKCEHPIYNMPRYVAEIIVSLNDDHNWTYQEIADWLESEGL